MKDEITWDDLSSLCPICDEEGGWFSGGCSKGHYQLSWGNYHSDVSVEGKWVAHFDECQDDTPEEKNLLAAILDARKNIGNNEAPKSTLLIKLIEKYGKEAKPEWKRGYII